MSAAPVWDALADPTRREIVTRLAEQDLAAGEIAEFFPVSRPGISRHLRVLREAGLVSVRGQAQRRIYRLEPEAIDPVGQWCSQVTTFWNQRLDALETEIARGRRATRDADPAPGAEPEETP